MPTCTFQNNESINCEEISFIKRGFDLHKISVAKGKEDNQVELKFEEVSQYDSGVFLPEAMSSVNVPEDVLKNHNTVRKGEVLQESLNSSTPHFVVCNTPSPVLNVLQDNNNQDSKNEIGGVDLKTSNETPRLFFAESQTSQFPSSTVNSKFSAENIENLIYDTVDRINNILDGKEPETTVSQHIVGCPVGISEQLVDSSDIMGFVFHENDQEVFTKTSSCDNIPQPLISKESVFSTTSLQNVDSTISIFNIPDGFNVLKGKRDVVTNSTFSVLQVFKYQEVDCNKIMIEDVTDTEIVDARAGSLGTFVSKVAEENGHSETFSNEDICLYSALENIEAFATEENRKQVLAAIQNEGQSLIPLDKDKFSCKKRFHKTYSKSEEVHPNKISESFDLFIKNMLLDSDICDSGCQNDNTSACLEDDLHEQYLNVANKVTNLTDDNKRLNCLELLKEASITELPDDRKASPRCINVDGIVSNSVNKNNDVCSQYVCDSVTAISYNENSLAVSDVIVNTVVTCPSEFTQSPMYSKYQCSSSSVSDNKPKPSEESAGKNSMDSYDEEGIRDNSKANNEKSSKPISKSDNLPSFDVNIGSSNNNTPSHNQLLFSSPVPVVVKVKGKSPKKDKVNNFLRNFEDKLENCGDFNRCDSEYNNNTENISSANKNILAPRTKEEELINIGHEKTDEEELSVTLEKNWGTLGIQIEVCCNFS